MINSKNERHSLMNRCSHTSMIDLHPFFYFAFFCWLDDLLDFNSIFIDCICKTFHFIERNSIRLKIQLSQCLEIQEWNQLKIKWRILTWLFRKRSQRYSRLSLSIWFHPRWSSINVWIGENNTIDPICVKWSCLYLILLQSIGKIFHSIWSYLIQSKI